MEVVRLQGARGQVTLSTAYREPLGWELLLLVGHELADRLRQSEVAELGLKKGRMAGVDTGEVGA